MAVQVKIDIQQLATLAKLQAFTEATSNDFILDEAGSFLLNRIRTRFLQERDPNNQPWIPSEAAIRRRKKGGTGTLFDTGDLYRSIQLAIINDRQRAIGTDVPYGHHHQFGTGKFPQRQFLGFNDDDADVLGKLLMKRIADKIEKA